MKTKLLLAVLFITVQFAIAQKDSSALMQEIYKFQDDLNNEYKRPEASPLPKKEREAFKHLNFFPINMRYVVNAKFTRTTDEKIFAMATSGSEKKNYMKYGEVSFSLMEKQYKLNVYQSIDLARQRKYRNYLFIPFRDATSGKETYGGGRYLDLTIPQGDEIQLNFNLAYHPYCAYAEGFNCPIPPRENYLPVMVEAGVRF